ncbi:MAG TPA: ribosome maturation factor RimM [Polyangia bacterium]|nr:ribosome maturation factor RimM [Polyangia bacterium]
MAIPYDPDTVVLGSVGKPHGVHGEVWLRPHNPQGRPFEGLRELILVKDGVATTRAIVALRPAEGGALARLAGVETREAAAALGLAEVRARRAAMPPLSPGEFYVGDVIGCAVVHESGRALGVVASTFWNGAQDVMVVAGPDGQEDLVPLLPQFVVTMDAPGRKIVVSWEPLGDDE